MLDIPAGQRPPLNLFQEIGACRAELIVATTGQTHVGETERRDPGCAGGDVAQVAVEQGHRGGDLAQELRAPIIRPIRVGTHARRRRAPAEWIVIGSPIPQPIS
jgi:hypothetical protein